MTFAKDTLELTNQIFEAVSQAEEEALSQRDFDDNSLTMRAVGAGQDSETLRKFKEQMLSDLDRDVPADFAKECVDTYDFYPEIGDWLRLAELAKLMAEELANDPEYVVSVETRVLNAYAEMLREKEAAD